MSELIVYGTEAVYTVRIDDLRPKCFESPPINLNDLNWTVKFCKELDTNGTTMLNSGLALIPDQKTPHNSSLLVKASFKLISKFTGTSKVILKNITQVFNRMSSIHDIELIAFDTLLTDFVYNDKFTVEIKILVSPKFQDPLHSSENIRLNRFNVITDNRVEVYSAPKMYLQGAWWNVVVRKENNHGIFIGLNLNHSKYDLNQWAWNATFSYKFVSFDRTEISKKQQLQNMFIFEGIKWKHALPWNSFHKSYVRDNKVVINCELKVEPPKPLWDIHLYTDIDQS